jgi:hypothetical protein
MIKRSDGKWLGKNIYKLIPRGNEVNLNIFLGNLIVYKMVVNLHMFNTSMKNMIGGQKSGN